MRDYGKVHASFWSSATTRALSEDGRMLALYLLTSPHSTIAGVFRLPDGYACEDLQWTSGRVAKGFAELLANGFANRCETTKWVWVNKHLEWNPPENPNQRKAAAKCALQVPAECGWKLAFMRVCAGSLGIDWQENDNPSGTLPEPLLNQKQKQEQKQKSCDEPETVSTPVVSIPLVDGSDFSVTAEQLSEWRPAFPAIDVEQQARAMREWCLSNPANRKTPAGIRRFMTAWLTRAQDKAPRGAVVPIRSADAFAGAI